MIGLLTFPTKAGMLAASTAVAERRREGAPTAVALQAGVVVATSMRKVETAAELKDGH